ncbi:MAG: hypothetical protein ABIJ27_01395 [Candidatus Omnitrophota bacterium]
MSIITDALKRAEKNREHTKTYPRIMPEFEGPYRGSPKRKLRVSVAAASGVILIAVSTISLRALNPASSAATHSAAVHEVIRSPVSEQAGAAGKALEEPLEIDHGWLEGDFGIPAKNDSRSGGGESSSAAGADFPVYRSAGNDFALNGIMYAAQKPLAIVNDATVSVGDAINGATVVLILENRVILERDGESIALDLR